ncbi:Cytochrome b6-f complex iron-sulfur subunit [Sulfuracidifex tepidarius]|uniref:Cytochrome b6-f complex iron-sulfur subunit n=2 Tax=Sulfuracidifex tepidarius TaxID=1294262 RepID=A0A510DX61_9CREN|nr:Cytochrome b6-f complex iron-sulfur subunit [Sulfuracidifex tepidarius]BBG27605.1 Cytochrome b6-f complex iron-sulfur subunit [Sulfuracidifex tepidarius]
MRKVIISRDDLAFAWKLVWKMRHGKEKFDQEKFMKAGRGYLYNYAEQNVGPLSPGRRAFLKGVLIGIGVVTVASALPLVSVLNPQEVTLKSFPWIVIVDSNGNPIKASTFPVNEPTIMLFQYPMLGDITFLLNMGDENDKPVAIPPTKVTIPQNGATYDFPGGVGPNKSIVAYSAICQHLGCAPPEIHFYPPKYFSPGGNVPNFLPSSAYQAAVAAGAKSIIHCDCHGSTYDPWHGAAVVTGPTVRPLPYVQLYWDQDTDFLYAVSMNTKAPPIMDHTSDLEGAAYLDSYDSKTQCGKLILGQNQKPSNCYTELQSDGNTFSGGS